MPYYFWKGVDLFIVNHKGKIYAESTKDIERRLNRKNIALTRLVEIKYFKSINLSHKVNFLNQLSVLLESGILLPKALELLFNQEKNIFFKEVLEDLYIEVRAGSSFFKALIPYSNLFGSLTVKIISAGEESGRLFSALDIISKYMNERKIFLKKIKSALIMPVLIFIFFIIVALIIFVFVAPGFASFFSSFDKPAPKSMKIILKISSILSNKFIFLFLILLSALLFLLRKLIRFFFVDVLFPNTSFFRNYYLIYFLDVMVILLDSGIFITSAISFFVDSVDNNYIKKKFILLERKVRSGSSLSEAMAEELFFPAYLTSIVRVGEESGRLLNVLKRGSNFYKLEIRTFLEFVSVVIQPILILVLGSLVALLIFAIYIPILNISNLISI